MALPQQRGDWPGRASCAVIRSAAAARGAGPGRAWAPCRARPALPALNAFFESGCRARPKIGTELKSLFYFVYFKVSNWPEKLSLKKKKCFVKKKKTNTVFIKKKKNSIS